MSAITDEYKEYLKLYKGKPVVLNYYYEIKRKGFTLEEILEGKYKTDDLIKVQYEKYLELKVGTPFKYNRFWNLLFDYSFEEILEMKHRKDLPKWGNGGEKKCKYDESYIKLISGAIESGNSYKSVSINFGITENKVSYIYSVFRNKIKPYRRDLFS